MNSGFLEDLTLISLVCNNQDYARRQIAYFSLVPISLIIADGSTEPMFDASFDRRQFGSCFVSYFHAPGADTFLQRIHHAATLVSTPFASLIDTGDIYFITGFERAIATLKADSSLAFAAGRVSSCVLTADSKSSSFLDWGHWSKPFALKDESPCLRLRKLISNMRTGNMCYGAMPSSMLLKISKYLPLKTPFTCNAAFELLWAGSLAINSNFEIGGYPFWVRGNAPGVPAKSYVKLDAVEWHTSWPLDKIYFVNCLVIELVKVGRIPVASATEAILDYLAVHRTQSVKPRFYACKYYTRKFKNLVKLILLPFLKHILLTHCASSFPRPISADSGIPKSLLAYWQSIFPDLDPAQVSDIERYDHILAKYPFGIPNEHFINLTSRRRDY